MDVGTQVGAYRVLRQIGEGGMGTVWLAEHIMLGRRAALKMLHPMFSAQPDVVTRFFNEARAATAILDPGIVQIFDFGHHVDGSAYIAMEMLEGEPLDRRLRRLGRLPVNEALRIIRQTASSLGVAHQRGIVHRDLKPENIFLVRDPEVPAGERPKILDFGIAKLIGDASSKTSTSAVMGTPMYMSPEQCRGAGNVDQRSDVYALGCMLFTLLTGGPPFEAESAGEIIAMHLREPPPAPSSRAPGIPPEFDVLVLRCLAKNPAQRFVSATELATEIGHLLGAPAIAGLQVAGGLPPAAVPWPATVAAAATTLSQGAGASIMPVPRSSRGVWIGTLSAVVVGGAITAGIVVGDGFPAASPPKMASPAAGIVTPAAGIATPAAGIATPAAGIATPVTPAASSESTIRLAKQMHAVLARFVEWARTHAGEPCHASLAVTSSASDPWGHPLALTCTDQPAGQMAGVISAGPDGEMGTPDDVASWQLAREVTDVAHGARWSAIAPSPRAPPKKPLGAKPAAAAASDIPSDR